MWAMLSLRAAMPSALDYFSNLRRRFLRDINTYSALPLYFRALMLSIHQTMDQRVRRLIGGR